VPLAPKKTNESLNLLFPATSHNSSLTNVLQSQGSNRNHFERKQTLLQHGSLEDSLVFNEAASAKDLAAETAPFLISGSQINNRESRVTVCSLEDKKPEFRVSVEPKKKHPLAHFEKSFQVSSQRKGALNLANTVIDSAMLFKKDAEGVTAAETRQRKLAH